MRSKPPSWETAASCAARAVRDRISPQVAGASTYEDCNRIKHTRVVSFHVFNSYDECPATGRIVIVRTAHTVCSVTMRPTAAKNC